MKLIKAGLFASLFVLSTVAVGDDWKVLANRPKPQLTTECFVGSKTDETYRYEISKHATEKAACQDAKDRKTDPTELEFGKCPSYTKDTVANCKRAGVTL